MERNLIRERTSAALAVKRANGLRVGSIPYGHDLDRDGKMLVRNEPEQSVIQATRHMRTGGLSFGRIAGILTGRGIPTKTGKSRSWHWTAVRRILERTRLQSWRGLNTHNVTTE